MPKNLFIGIALFSAAAFAGDVKLDFTRKLESVDINVYEDGVSLVTIEVPTKEVQTTLTAVDGDYGNASCDLKTKYAKQSNGDVRRYLVIKPNLDVDDGSSCTLKVKLGNGKSATVGMSANGG